MNLSKQSLEIKLNDLIKNKKTMPIDEYIWQMTELKKLIDLSIENILFQNSVIKWFDEI